MRELVCLGVHCWPVAAAARADAVTTAFRDILEIGLPQEKKKSDKAGGTPPL
jgi:hypothetical protein